MAKILPMTEPNLSGHFDIHSRDGCGTTLWHLWHPMALPWVPDTPPLDKSKIRSRDRNCSEIFMTDVFL